MSEGFPHLPKSEIESVADSTNKVIQRIKTHSQKYVPMLTKNCGKFDKLYNDLIAEPINSSTAKSSTNIEEGEEQEKIEENVSEPELSVHGQYLLLESLSNLKKVIGEMSQDHKHPIHHLVSRCGKAIDQRFHSDISKLLKNEKEIESDPENLAHANRLIFEHLMGLGRTEMAETFQKESEMSLKLPNISNFDTLKEIMNAFKCNDYLPAINWVMENVPSRSDLLFRLKCQHIIQLLETKDKLAALRSVRELQSFPLEMNQYKEELTHLMFVVISYPQKGPYEYLFHKGRWFALEQELAHALTEYRGSLGTILSAGIKTIPSLMTMRAFLSSARPGNCPILPDELPCNVPVPEQVHSSFCCPILKVQSTESNPPVRLCCGHVISTDAMNKLAQQSRNNRLKCPYCPLESVLQETKVLHF